MVAVDMSKEWMKGSGSKTSRKKSKGGNKETEIKRRMDKPLWDVVPRKERKDT